MRFSVLRAHDYTDPTTAASAPVSAAPPVPAAPHVPATSSAPVVPCVHVTIPVLLVSPVAASVACTQIAASGLPDPELTITRLRP